MPAGLKGPQMPGTTRDQNSQWKNQQPGFNPQNRYPPGPFPPYTNNNHQYPQSNPQYPPSTQYPVINPTSMQYPPRTEYPSGSQYPAQIPPCDNEDWNSGRPLPVINSTSVQY